MLSISKQQKHLKDVFLKGKKIKKTSKREREREKQKEGMGGLRRTQGKYMSIIYGYLKIFNLQLCKKQQIYTFVEQESDKYLVYILLHKLVDLTIIKIIGYFFVYRLIRCFLT